MPEGSLGGGGDRTAGLQHQDLGVVGNDIRIGLAEVNGVTVGVLGLVPLVQHRQAAAVEQPAGGVGGVLFQLGGQGLRRLLQRGGVAAVRHLGLAGGKRLVRQAGGT